METKPADGQAPFAITMDNARLDHRLVDPGDLRHPRISAANVGWNQDHH